MKLKSVLFDFDGVFTDSENTWTKYDSGFLISLFGEEKYFELKFSIVGLSIRKIYELFQSNNVVISWEDFYSKYIKLEKYVYEESPLNLNIVPLIVKLRERNIKIGIVSNSPSYIIVPILEKLRVYDFVDAIISTDTHKHLNQKPNPDFYLEAIKELEVTSLETIVIEDSQTGVFAAKSAGLKVVCLKEFHHDGYVVEGADYYVDSTTDLFNTLL
jgi:mannitol-1-/sugar-/sorbitol-6-/2-deoxyglucose-6-phosphatase